MVVEFKPYEIVKVQHADYSHLGQIISRETDTGTYMVRLVPGDPCTMKECRADMLSEVPSMNGGSKWLRSVTKKLWVHYAEVKGIGEFPIDMLRYMGAAPVNFMFVPVGEYGTEAVLNEGETVHIIGKLSHTRVVNVWEFGKERWASFGWAIKRLKVVELIPGV